jgi:molybdopterin molybdotransferase
VLGALSDLGLETHFSRIAVKPGKPTVFATCDGPEGRVAFGLPGNPVSSYLMFHIFVLRAISRMTAADVPLMEIRLPLGRSFMRKKVKRLQFVPGRIQKNGKVEAVEFHGSGHLAGVLQAHGFFQVPVGTAELPAGSEVTFLPMPGRL